MQFSTEKIFPVACEFSNVGGSDRFFLSEKTKMALFECPIKLKNWVLLYNEDGIELHKQEYFEVVQKPKQKRKISSEPSFQELKRLCRIAQIDVLKEDNKDVLKAKLNSISLS